MIYACFFKCAYQTVIGADGEFTRRFEQAGFSEHISEGLSARLIKFKEEYLLEKNPRQIKIDRLYRLCEEVKSSGYAESGIKLIENGIDELSGNEAGLDISSELNELIKTWNKSEKKTSFLVDFVASKLRHMEAESGVGGAAMVHLNTLLKISASGNTTCKI